MNRSFVGAVAVAGLLFSTSVFAQPEIRFNGSAQYRIRANIDNGTNADGTDMPSVMNAHHQYGWAFGVNAKANDEVSVVLQLENVGSNAYSTSVATNEGIYDGKNAGVILTRAYFAYTKGTFSFEGGIVPVSKNTTYDVGFHTINGDNYFNMSDGWNEIQSQAGMNLGYRAADNLRMNLNLATTGNQGRLIPDNDEQVLDGYRVGFTAPVTAGNLTITPAIQTESGIYKLDDTGNRIPGESNMMFAGGVDLRLRPASNLDLRAGVGIGNIEVEGQNERTSFLITLDPRFSLANGRLVTAYSLAISNNDLNEVSYMMHYIDINYTHNLNSNFSVRPRLRTYIRSNDTDDYNHTRLRPEVIFAARF
ncbi:RND efflux system, inner membrane transporter CmeB [Chitinispirillum alkaliphilum]|nr:RND efflux system, inner membrane transporter CmeB [Chitinispirillum alkaliphilum]